MNYITKTFRFEAAHMLVGHDGPCARLHGHSYKVEVTFSGTLIEGGPKDGMVMDFGDIARFWHQNLEPRLDHRFLLPEESRELFINFAPWLSESVSPLPVARTTAENIAGWLLEEFKALDVEVLTPTSFGHERHATNVTQVAVWETETGCARAVRS